MRSSASVPKVKLGAAPKMPKLTQAVVKGPGIPKLKAPGIAKLPELPSLSVQARRGLTPKVQLAKAAAGASANTSKRNSYYPTP